MHTRKRSVAKSITWRSIGVMLLAVVTYVITRDLLVVTLITMLHHTAFAFIFYFHDRAWERIADRVPSNKYVWLKSFTYEIVLGFLVLGFLTWIVTGSWGAVTQITIVYLGTRYFLFPVHEWYYARLNRRRQAH